MYENSRGEIRLPFERGKTISAPYPGWPETPALVSAGWAEEGMLRVRCYAVGDAPCGFDLLVSLAGDWATVQSRRSSDPLTAEYEGIASGKRIR